MPKLNDVVTLIKETNQRNERINERFEEVFDKQTEILQQVANAVTTLNHNSDTMVLCLNDMKAKTDIQNATLKLLTDNMSVREGKYLSMIKYIVYSVLAIAAGLFALKQL